MKARQLNIITIILAITLFPISLFAQSNAVPSQSLDEIIEGLPTPQKVVSLMSKEFDFVEDSRLFSTYDYWQSPEEIWQRKKGDCEDYALFAQYALKKQGIEAEVVSVYSADGYAHTVTIFKEKGLFRVINQDKLESFRANSIEDAISQLNPEWTWAAVAKPKAARGHNQRTILNPSPSNEGSTFPQHKFLL